jgi:hypothetical protein
MRFPQFLQRCRQSLKNRSRPAPQPNKFRRRPELEVLENRLLPSTISWTNRGRFGADTDHFAARYGANAETARRDVDQAIADWQGVIQHFYPVSDPNPDPYTYNLSV